MDPTLVDRIYDAAVAPELWPSVLDEVAASVEATGGLLFAVNASLRWTASEPLQEVFDAYVADGWFQRCSRRLCLMGQSDPGFFVEQDFWSEDQLRQDPIYRDFFRPRGLGWSAGTGLRMTTGDNIVFSMERRLERGPVEPEHVARLNALRPHLARSALITARLGLQRAQGAAQALALMGLPALVLDQAGRVTESSPATDDGLAIPLAGERVAFDDRAAAASLGEALAEMSTTGEASPRSFPVRDRHGNAAQVAHLLPLRCAARDVFGGGYALLVLTPIRPDRSPSSDLLRSLFDLTPAEARVARQLAEGRALAEIAEASDVGLNTVRTQLRRVLEKTGCGRQAELVALLTSVALGRA